MRFHPIGGGPKSTKMDKDGSRQETHPLLVDWRLWPSGPEYHAVIRLGCEPEDSQYGEYGPNEIVAA